MIIFVDIDETICTTEINDDQLDYTDANPLYDNINKINNLYDKGHTIVYWTARGSKTGVNWFDMTLRQLHKWNCKFNELRMGKPYYDLIIDDKSKRIEEI